MSVEIVKSESQSTAALMHQVVDARLSRNELLDLIVERIDAEYRERLDALDKQKEALPKVTTRDVISLLRERGVATMGAGYSSRREDTWEVSLKVTVPRADLPERVRDLLKREEEIDAERSAVKSQRDRLKWGKREARLEMVRVTLESTAEGRKVMEAIDALKTFVKQKLLPAKS